MILALSLGNTNLRYQLRETAGDRVLRRGVIAIEGGALRRETVARLLAAGEGSTAGVRAGNGSGDADAVEVIVASVHPVALDRVEKILSELGVTPRVAGRDFPLPIANRYREPAAAGIDRLLGVLAAVRAFPGEGVIVVDLGTAMTVNVGSPEGEFLGGFIGVGLGTASRALAEHAPRLPPIRFDAGPPPGPGEALTVAGLPRETDAAIRSGLLLEIAGGVRHIVEGLAGALPWPARALATGGDAELVAPLVPPIERVVPDLVLDGLVASWREASS